MERSTEQVLRQRQQESAAYARSVLLPDEIDDILETWQNEPTSVIRERKFRADALEYAEKWLEANR